jgi:hypothetical protein
MTFGGFLYAVGAAFFATFAGVKFAIVFRGYKRWILQSIYGSIALALSGLCLVQLLTY